MSDVMTLRQQRDLLAGALMAVTDGPPDEDALSLADRRKVASEVLDLLSDEGVIACEVCNDMKYTDCKCEQSQAAHMYPIDDGCTNTKCPACNSD